MGERINWSNEFQKMGLDDTGIGISRASSGHEYNFQHSLDQPEGKSNDYSDYDPAVTLRYRDSVSSSASSLSRNSTISSTDTRYFSTMGSPNGPQPPTINMNTWNHSNAPSPLSIPAHRIERPNNLSPVHHQFPHIPFAERPQQQVSIVEPTGCFVPIRSLPFIQKSNITKHHYVIPSFAMAGESQAEVMKLLFNETDATAFKPKEEHERTIPWTIDENSSLVTLSQYTSLGQETPVTRNYLIGLGQRLGITTIIVVVSIEVIGTVYPLLDNLIKSMELDTNDSQEQEQQQPSWWSRVVLVINQQHGVSDQTAYNQRRSILVDEMPRIQERYGLSNPLSILFLSTQVFDRLQSTNQGGHYKSCCQRILWQMMEKHMLSGRWCSELVGLHTRVPPNTSLINILNEDDETSSSSDDAIFKTVIDFVDGKKKKLVKKKKTIVQQQETIVNNNHLMPATPLQRRSTRRQFQKLHCHDGDDGMSLPTITRHV
ncbi:hypothetical protein HPULCUR_008161 [Helicostylum pulchrum]|uniref:Uncharacterized protein n=1 Tax=Helicostylum pulchrum TaxID=562976 RepID=A0ABP9Y8S3_9FUNG